MNEIKIRKALLGDLEQLLVFEQDLIKTERPFDLTLKPDPINYYDLESLLTRAVRRNGGMGRGPLLSPDSSPDLPPEPRTDARTDRAHRSRALSRSGKTGVAASGRNVRLSEGVRALASRNVAAEVMRRLTFRRSSANWIPGLLKAGR